MNDARKAGILVGGATAIIALTLIFNLAGETLVSPLIKRLERKMYFERVISKKGLSLHKARFWEEVKEDGEAR